MKKVVESCRKVVENIDANDRNLYYCKLCDYTALRKDYYEKHILTSKHLNGEKRTKRTEKVVNEFYCKNCDYKTYRKDVYNRHILTAKHLKVAKQIENDNDFLKNLILENMKITASLVENQNRQQILTNTISNNNINSNNTVNQKFNLNLFLNEKCKDALNITEFIELIQLSLQDFLQTAQLGYTDGISKIINDKIKETGEEKRPFHCTDVKREVVYVKDNNIWEKEPPEKPKITKLIDGLVTKNFQKLAEYKEENPECDDISCVKGKEYFNIMCNLSGGNQSEREKKKDKIIKNLMKETTIEKNENLLL